MLLLALAAWKSLPYPTIKESKIHPALRHLNTSDRWEFSRYGDGGSLGIKIIQTDGNVVDMCVSKSLDLSRKQRGKLYIGSDYFDDSNSVEITEYDHTKYVVILELKKDANISSDTYEDIALLSGRFQDWIRYWISLVSG